MTHGEHIFLTKRCTTLYLTQHCGICILSIHPLQMWRQSLVNEREQRARRCAVDLEGVQHANEALHLAVVAQVYPKSSIFPNGGVGGVPPFSAMSSRTPICATARNSWSKMFSHHGVQNYHLVDLYFVRAHSFERNSEKTKMAWPEELTIENAMFDATT